MDETRATAFGDAGKRSNRQGIQEEPSDVHDGADLAEASSYLTSILIRFEHLMSLANVLDANVFTGHESHVNHSPLSRTCQLFFMLLE